MSKFTYGDSWEKFPIQQSQIWGLKNGSKVAVHDIFDPLPDWMKADLLFVDPPYNTGQLSSYYTKANITPTKNSFDKFTDILFTRIVEIGALTAYIEIGNQAVESWLERLSKLFEFIQHWKVTYYRKHPTNIIRGSNISKINFDYTGMDEEKCIYKLAEIETYNIIADPCMGRGLTGLAATKSCHPFIGTELNKRRLAVLLDKLERAKQQVYRYK